MNEPIYFMLLKNIRDQIPEAQRPSFDLQLALRQKSTTIALAFSLLTGVLGVDRFYLGQIGLGILKLITLGGCGFWTFIDWFLIMGAARSKNIEIANEIKSQLA